MPAVTIHAPPDRSRHPGDERASSGACNAHSALLTAADQKEFSMITQNVKSEPISLDNPVCKPGLLLIINMSVQHFSKS